MEILTRVYVITGPYDNPDKLLPHLPEWRRRKALSYRTELDRFLCAKSYLILEEMLREGFGLSACPEFSYGMHGKPFLKDYPDINFNISHCHKGIICAVSAHPVGVDIEEIMYDTDLLGFTLNDKEKTLVETSDEPGLRFTEIWTRKESYLKLTGEGLTDNLKDILSDASCVNFKTDSNREAGYVLSVAFDGKL